MIREHLQEPYSITYRTVDKSPETEHVHSFFELVYILSGTGTQCINKSRFAYRDGHMFLITPEDCHSFEVESTTSFFFLRFNDIYLKNGGLPRENMQRLEFILQNANHRPGCILRNQTDKLLVRPMVEAVMREYANKDIYNRELVQQIVNTLIIIVARNIARYQEPSGLPEQSDERTQDILRYVQAHIYQPEKLRTAQLSERFHVSSAYLGRYFKQRTGQTLQEYTGSYKARLIAHRLQYSDKRISEIAEEFNFSDESHLAKFFKKQQGSSPRAYREQVRKGEKAAVVA